MSEARLADDQLHDDHEVDRLVVEYLADQAMRVDAGRVLAGVRARIEREAGADQARPHSSRTVIGRGVRWGTGLALAASLLVAMFWNTRSNPVRADVVKVVREAQALLEERADRAYRVRVELTDGAALRHPILAVLSRCDARLWTRGDRYWIEVSRAGHAWAWGRDEQRRVWLAPDRNSGLVFEPEEIPEALSVAQDFHSLNLDLLMKQILTEFDIETAESAEDRSSGVTRIEARIKPGREHSRIRAVTLEIDNRTKLIREVVVSRMINGESPARVFYTFERVEPQADERYRVEGHIDAEATKSGASERPARRLRLMQFLGSLLMSEP
jgi:hypothetical protein